MHASFSALSKLIGQVNGIWSIGMKFVLGKACTSNGWYFGEKGIMFLITEYTVDSERLDLRKHTHISGE